MVFLVAVRPRECLRNTSEEGGDRQVIADDTYKVAVLVLEVDLVLVPTLIPFVSSSKLSTLESNQMRKEDMDDCQRTHASSTSSSINSADLITFLGVAWTRGCLEVHQQIVP